MWVSKKVTSTFNKKHREPPALAAEKHGKSRDCSKFNLEHLQFQDEYFEGIGGRRP